MEKLNLWLLAIKIECNWWFILRIRRKGNNLLKKGAPLSSQKLYRLNCNLSKHSTRAMKAQALYDKLVKT